MIKVVRIAMVALTLVPALATAVPTVRVDRFNESDGREVAASAANEFTGAGVEVASDVRVAGVATGDLRATPAFPDLYVTAVRPGDRLLCVRLVSADGLYRARALVPITPALAAAGALRLTLPTRKRSRFHEPASEMAATITASGGGDCLGSAAILPSAWRAVPPPRPPIVLIGGRGNTVPEIRRLDESLGVACRDIDQVTGLYGRSRAGYRFACTPRAAATPAADCTADDSFRIDWRVVEENKLDTDNDLRFRIRRRCR